MSNDQNYFSSIMYYTLFFVTNQHIVADRETAYFYSKNTLDKTFKLNYNKQAVSLSTVCLSSGNVEKSRSLVERARLEIV